MSKGLVPNLELNKYLAIFIKVRHCKHSLSLTHPRRSSVNILNSSVNILKFSEYSSVNILKFSEIYDCEPFWWRSEEGRILLLFSYINQI